MLRLTDTHYSLPPSERCDLLTWASLHSDASGFILRYRTLLPASRHARCERACAAYVHVWSVSLCRVHSVKLKTERPHTQSWPFRAWTIERMWRRGGAPISRAILAAAQRRCISTARRFFLQGKAAVTRNLSVRCRTPIGSTSWTRV
jgi:hypothetical protein